jgi:hypothetical protein
MTDELTLPQDHGSILVSLQQSVFIVTLQCFFSVIASISPIITSSYILQSNSSSSMQKLQDLSLSLFLSLTIMWNCPTDENALQNRWMCVCVCLSLCVSVSHNDVDFLGRSKCLAREIVCLSMATKKWQEHPDCVKAVIFQTSSLNSQSPHKF